MPIMMYSYAARPMNNADARHALRTIRRCIERDRIRLTQHFRVRLVERGILWPDVLAVFDDPVTMQSDGFDEVGRVRWIASGESADGVGMGLVCAIGRDHAGALTVFITAVWKD